MTILTDIGGTFVRFAKARNGQPSDIRKYKAVDFPDLQSALAKYCEETGIEARGALLIATAGYNDGGVWKFVNQNTWEIDPKALAAAGWCVEKILNDFEAATWSLISLKEANQTVLKAGNSERESGSLCLLGPGTGLGLGYLHKAAVSPFVQKTHGGHMPIAARSDEQWQAIKRTDTSVFENIVSGPGLQKLRGLYDEEKALRLFHEFLGLFAANAVITGHAYGGLYLTGGVLERLIEEGAFDLQIFEKWFCLQGAASVGEALDNTPITYITDPYPALKGLLNA